MESVEVSTSSGRRYKLNERFFDEWSPQMAYALGFWFADGNMRQEKSYRVTFTSVDKDHLLQIRKIFSSTQPLRGRREKSGGVTWDLILCSKHLYKQLEALGGQRRKSKIMKFPYIPSRYLPDFIRGYFDGDGSVCFVSYTRTKDRRIARELRTSFTSGSREFLVDLMQVLYEEIGLPFKDLGIYNKGTSLKLGYGMKDSDALLHYMYYVNFPIGLKRKADFLLRIPTYQVHN